MPDWNDAAAAADRRRRYNNACDSIRMYDRWIAEEKDNKIRAERQLPGIKKEKKSLERRLEEVKKIIKMMDGSAWGFSTDVPESISKSNKASTDAGSDYKGCVRCDGVTSANFTDKFDSKSVTGDTNSNNALSELRKEQSRIERTIAELERNIRTLENNIETYKANIRRYESERSYWVGVKWRNA